MTDDMTHRILRAMAWERAKGEMRAALCTYVNEPEEYKKADEAVDSFITHIEENGMLGT